jgi:hypothetical protein
MSKIMQRAMRGARAVLHGLEILAFMQQPRTRRRLVEAADLGVPPATEISLELLQLIGPKDAKLTPVRQFAGLCMRAVLEEEGFELADVGVRLSKDPMFRTGSVYRRATEVDSKDLLARIVEALNDNEMARLKALVRRRGRK